jgi:hypothetical protein
LAKFASNTDRGCPHPQHAKFEPDARTFKGLIVAIRRGWEQPRSEKSLQHEPAARFLAEKNGGGLEKGLANLWSRKRITKIARVGHGQETKWEILAKMDGGPNEAD